MPALSFVALAFFSTLLIVLCEFYFVSGFEAGDDEASQSSYLSTTEKIFYLHVNKYRLISLTKMESRGKI